MRVFRFSSAASRVQSAKEPNFNGSQTKRYKGGTAQNLWKFGPGMKEAVPLTTDFEGTSKRPMW